MRRNERKSKSFMTRIKKQITVDALIDKVSAELIEALLQAGAKDGSQPWFFIARNKLRSFHSAIEQIEVRSHWRKK